MRTSDSISKIAPALLKAQRNLSPEGRMEEAGILRSMLTGGRSDRCKDGTPTLDRFMAKVAFGASDCWYWIGRTDALGYGRISAIGESKAHRVAYRMFRGDINGDARVMHSCDTRCCVNPDHLSLGSQADNIADMVRKGRSRGGGLAGEKNPMAKATEEVVAAIRSEVSNGAKQVEMARKFNLSPMAVSRIVRKESWK